MEESKSARRNTERQKEKESMKEKTKEKDQKEKEKDKHKHKDKEKEKEQEKEAGHRRRNSTRRERSKEAVKDEVRHKESDKEKEKEKDKEKERNKDKEDEKERRDKERKERLLRGRDALRSSRAEIATSEDAKTAKQQQSGEQKIAAAAISDADDAEEGNTSDEAERLGLTPVQKKKLSRSRAKERWKRHRSAEAVKDEVASLRGLAVPPEEPGPLESFNFLSEEVFKHHRILEEVARSCNSSLGAPEVVVVGFRSHGKTSLIEALIGQQVGLVSFLTEGATKRPVHYRLLNLTETKGRPNPNTPPKCFIQHDPLLREEGTEVPLRNLPKEIARRSQQLSAIPLVIVLHHPFLMDMVVIDTPGLMPPNPAGPESLSSIELESNLETIALNAAADAGSGRVVLCVEEAGGWQRSAILPFARRIDPSFHRLHLVFTKFHSFLKGILNSREKANTYLAGGKNDAVKCFWVSVPSAKARVHCEDALSWQELVWKTHHRDLAALRDLQVKKKYMNNVGLLALRRTVLLELWKEAVDDAPQLLKQLRTQVVDLEVESRLLETRIRTLAPGNLREMANRYVSGLVRTLRRISFGSAEAEAALYGQTTEDETNAQGGIMWTDASGQLLDTDRWPLAFRSCRLYGGQQLERLLNEFRLVAMHLTLPAHEVKLAELLAAAGTRRTPAGNVDLMWAACTIGEKKARDVMEGLLDAALRRLAHLVSRSFHIAMSIVSLPDGELWFARETRTSEEGPVDESSNKPAASDVGGFTYFTHWIEAEFEAYLAKLVEDCKRRCKEHFLSVSTIYWLFVERSEAAGQADSAQEARGQDLARRVFEESRDRLTREFLIKFYDFFIARLDGNIEGALQVVVGAMNEAQLAQKFQLAAVARQLEAQEKVLAEALKTARKNEYIFCSSCPEFTVPILQTLLC